MALGDIELIDMADPPFAVAPDVILDVPVPPSVNRTRKVHWSGHRKIEAWHKHADMRLMASGQYRKARKIEGGYELNVILDETKCAADPDNTLKAAIDYLRRLELIKNDSPKFARRLVVTWGHAPEGCRLILRGHE